MKTLEQIRSQLSGGEFDFSRHAMKRAVERNIGKQEIGQAGMTATIVEEYPEDKYSPSCLSRGFTRAGRPLHIQVSLADGDLVKIITLYEHRAEEWIEYSRRRGSMFTCSVCGAGDGREELVEEVFRIDGKYVLVDRIPATVCARCGEESFSRETTERIRLVVHGRTEPTKSVALKVLEFA